VWLTCGGRGCWRRRRADGGSPWAGQVAPRWPHTRSQQSARRHLCTLGLPGGCGCSKAGSFQAPDVPGWYCCCCYCVHAAVQLGWPHHVSHAHRCRRRPGGARGGQGLVGRGRREGGAWAEAGPGGPAGGLQKQGLSALPPSAGSVRLQAPCSCRPQLALSDCRRPALAALSRRCPTAGALLLLPLPACMVGRVGRDASRCQGSAMQECMTRAQGEAGVRGCRRMGRDSCTDRPCCHLVGCRRTRACATWRRWSGSQPT
jgi:hypothetical protein